VDGEEIPAGNYDVTLRLHVPPAKSPDAGVLARVLPAARVCWIVPSVSVASFYCPDTEKPQPLPLRFILANYTATTVTAATTFTVTPLAQERPVAVFEGSSSMKPYPHGFYGTFAFEWPTKDIPMGDYFVKAVAKLSSGETLSAEQVVKVGWRDGEIKGLYGPSRIRQGQGADFKLLIANTGNLALPVDIRWRVVSNSKEVYEERQRGEVPVGQETDFRFRWETGPPVNARLGTYHIEVTAIFAGKEQSLSCLM